MDQNDVALAIRNQAKLRKRLEWVQGRITELVIEEMKLQEIISMTESIAKVIEGVPVSHAFDVYWSNLDDVNREAKVEHRGATPELGWVAELHDEDGVVAIVTGLNESETRSAAELWIGLGDRVLASVQGP